MPHYIIAFLLASAFGWALMVDSRTTSGNVGRIVNRIKTWPVKFPYLAALHLAKINGTSYCGGSLIGETWILTAAHCTENVIKITVYLGSMGAIGSEVKRIVHSSAVYRHPDYEITGGYPRNDIALIKIEAVTYTYDIAPIQFPAVGCSNTTFAGEYAVTVGWGDSDDSLITPRFSRDLRFIRLTVISNRECLKFYKGITDNIICANTTSGIAPCRGDSGNPIVLESGNVLIGICSFVYKGGCSAGWPTGFVRTSPYLPWIRSITGIPYECVR